MNLKIPGTTEYLAVVLSMADGEVWDTLPDQARRRYREQAERTLRMADVLLLNAAKAGVWAEAIQEAHDCGHLHEPARNEMMDRNPYLTVKGEVEQRTQLTAIQEVNLERFIDRIARARYEAYDSHFSMPGGMSWEEYKQDDPDGAHALYIDPTISEVNLALPELSIAVARIRSHL